MNFVPERSQWTRCLKCGYCNYIVWKPSRVYVGGTYNSTGCKICLYNWNKATIVQSIVNRMKMEYQRELGKDVFGPEEPIKATLHLFRNSHCPEVLRECYQVAAAEFMTTFTKMWARNLQSKARNR
jgi:hypothetical protein